MVSQSHWPLPVSFISFSHTKQTSIPCWSHSSGGLTSPTDPYLTCLILSHKADLYTLLVPFFWWSHKSHWPLPHLSHSLTQSRPLYLVGPILLVVSQVPLTPTSPVSFSHTKQTSIPCWSHSSGGLTSPTDPYLTCLILSHKADLLPCWSRSSGCLARAPDRYAASSATGWCCLPPSGDRQRCACGWCAHFLPGPPARADWCRSCLRPGREGMQTLVFIPKD